MEELEKISQHLQKQKCSIAKRSLKREVIRILNLPKTCFLHTMKLLCCTIIGGDNYPLVPFPSKIIRKY